MSEHRFNGPGHSWYFCVRLADASSGQLVDEIAILRAAVALARERWPFDIDTAMVLPAQVQMIWTLPPGDSDYVRRWRLIRSAFSCQVSGARWQRGLREHLIRDSGDLTLYRHLCVTAPVRAGLVKRAADWPHSSVHPDRMRGRKFPAMAGRETGASIRIM